MNELAEMQLSQIVVTPGAIQFNDFEQLKSQAVELSEQINSVAVTEETVQASKKLLAAVNGRIKDLESRRISIKNEMLEPYKEFETQVKEIVEIVKSADKTVRDQVKNLEEIEREVKAVNIAGLYEKRISSYSFGEWFTVEDFIKPAHLNKSTSLKKVEEELVQWMEKVESDIKLINMSPNSHDVLTEYTVSQDVVSAMTVVAERINRRNVIAEQVKKAKAPTGNTVHIITIDDEKDFTMVRMFMQQNNIKYKSEKVEN